MAKKDTNNEHIRFAVLAVDIALFSLRNGELVVRLMKVNRPPHFNNIPGLPGGLILPSETSLESAERLVREKGKINTDIYLEQFSTFSEVNRDPRGRVVSIAYLGLVPWESLSEEEKKDANECWWGRAISNTKLAYDHNKIIDLAIKKFRSRLRQTTIVSKILPAEFTLSELEYAFKQILQTVIDKRNFRKKVQKLKILKSLKKMRKGMKHRPALIYAFNSKEVKDIEGI